MRLAATIVGATIVALVGMVVTPGDAAAANPGGRGRIVFTAVEDYTDNYNLWTVNPDGSELTQITFPDGPGDFHATWSPDGTRIAFTRASSSIGHEIWVVDGNGGNEVQVTDDGGYTPTLHIGNQMPSWSPAGDRILYTQIRVTWEGDEVVDESWNLYTINPNGTGKVQLTTDDDSEGGAWSPDGRYIAYSTSAGLKVMNANGTGKRLLVSPPEEGGVANQIDWSPDASRVLFDIADPHTPAYGMATIPVGGGTPQPVDFGTIDGGYGDMSPDATRWVIGASGRQDIYIVTNANTGVFRIPLPGIHDETTPDWQPKPPYPFGDIGPNPFLHDILWLRDQGITSGCTTFLFCPNGNVTRGQMASFLARALDLPSSATDYFSDDETSIHETDINRVAKAGITSGCTATTYCPLQLVTRGQMASFLARGFSLPSSATDYFSDDETSIHQTDINRVAKAGITSGCTATTYCPLQLVTRGQMAAFLHRALD